MGSVRGAKRATGAAFDLRTANRLGKDERDRSFWRGARPVDRHKPLRTPRRRLKQDRRPLLTVPMQFPFSRQIPPPFTPPLSTLHHISPSTLNSTRISTFPSLHLLNPSTLQSFPPLLLRCTLLSTTPPSSPSSTQSAQPKTTLPTSPP
jgi:hypothetical protein